MERISIFNYEAFYLDYLEGNLNEEDTALLFAFLEEHPECAFEDDELVTLQPKEFVYAEKDALKGISLSDSIHLNNVEEFMIASTEGLLNQKQQKELDAFVVANQLQSEFGLTKQLKLEPNTNEVYVDKAGLKQTRTIVIWPYFAAVAACLALFFWVTNFQSSSTDQQQLIANDASTTEDPINEIRTNVIDENTTDNIASFAVENTPRENKKNDRKRKRRYKQENNDFDVPRLQKQAPRNLISIANHTPEPIFNVSNLPPVTNQEEPPALASTGFEHMTNPIKPITKFVSEKTKKEIDFKTAKKDEKEKGGFYLKIGSFEVSRKKH